MRKHAGCPHVYPVYRANALAQSGIEHLPNVAVGPGTLEVIIAPYQRAMTVEAFPDVLFLWRHEVGRKQLARAARK